MDSIKNLGLFYNGNRQTGRTYGMLQAVLKAAYDGERPVVIAANFSQLQEMQYRYASMGGNPFQVYWLSYTNLTSASLAGIDKETQVFVDHYVVESALADSETKRNIQEDFIDDMSDELYQLREEYADLKKAYIDLADSYAGLMEEALDMEAYIDNSESDIAILEEEADELWAENQELRVNIDMLQQVYLNSCASTTVFITYLN